LLVFLIIVVSTAKWFYQATRPVPVFEDEQVIQWRKEVDSLQQEATGKEVQLFPFNPNFITDFKGYSLGMTPDQIDALKKFRAEDQWINSRQEFKNVTGVSDQWLDSIAPFFKFPDWVSRSNSYSENNDKELRVLSNDQKTDLNSATSTQLQMINGVGPKLSKRIIEYRDRFDGGFASLVELYEIYGLKEEVIDRIKARFDVKTPRTINRILVNSATSNELVTIPYIDYELAYQIIEYRTLHEGIDSIEELTKIQDFPENKINLIGLYLQF
jgi:competence protein ComEA